MNERPAWELFLFFTRCLLAPLNVSTAYKLNHRARSHFWPFSCSIFPNQSFSCPLIQKRQLRSLAQFLSSTTFHRLHQNHVDFWHWQTKPGSVHLSRSVCVFGVSKHQDKFQFHPRQLVDFVWWLQPTDRSSRNKWNRASEPSRRKHPCYLSDSSCSGKYKWWNKSVGFICYRRRGGSGRGVQDNGNRRSQVRESKWRN